METNVEKIMNQAHIKLMTVAPYIAGQIIIHGWFNILLGVTLFTQNSRFAGDILILNYVLSYQFWGIVFLLDGLCFLYAYYKNNWRLMSRILFFTLIITAFWWFAIFFRMIFDVTGNVILLVFWTYLLAVKFNTYIRFPPLSMRRIIENG